MGVLATLLLLPNRTLTDEALDCAEAKHQPTTSTTTIGPAR